MTQKKHPVLSALGIVCIAGLMLTAAFWGVVHLLGTDVSWAPSERIGIVPVKGVISDSQSVLSQLVDFRKDDRVKAIVLRIDSPGGAVGPTQEIYREIIKTLEIKPVVASVEAVAASGGYYVASAAGKIFANPGSITGSIGVLMEFVRVEELLTKLGISFEVIKSGQFKDIGSPHRKLSDQERALLDDLISDIQNQFVREVANARNLPEEQVREIADGRIFTGAKAKELGLIDELGNFHDAVDAAGQMAGLSGDAELVYPGKEGFDLWRLIREQIAGALIEVLNRGTAGRLEYRWEGGAY
jgi:protease IV